MLLPPRTVSELVAKAVGGAASLVMDQHYREAYLNYIRRGVIRDDVFFQNGSNILMGPFLVLSLLMELGQAKQAGFQVDEFLEGVRPALEQYHNVEKTLDNRVFDLLMENDDGKMMSDFQKKYKIPMMNSVFEKQYKLKPLKTVTNSSSSTASTAFTEEERSVMAGLAQREAEYAHSLTNRPSFLPNLSSVLDWDWKSSEAQQLQAMVSPDFFRSLQKDKTIGCMLHTMKGIELDYQDKSSKVLNVALLSARIMVMDQEEDADNFDTLQDDELDVDEEEEVVAAQIEVLYDLQHTVSVASRIFSDEGESLSKGEFTERLIRVSVWEGYLTGKDEGLRWVLSNVREPWEIPPADVDFDYHAK